MLTLQDLRRYRSLAEQHPNNVSSKIIIRLLDEIKVMREDNQLLNAAVFARKGALQPFCGDTSMPFGQYKGEALHDVPSEYLHWWLKRQNVEALSADAAVSPYPARGIAMLKLKLCDYIKNRNGSTI